MILWPGQGQGQGQGQGKARQDNPGQDRTGQGRALLGSAMAWHGMECKNESSSSSAALMQLLFLFLVILTATLMMMMTVVALPSCLLEMFPRWPLSGMGAPWIFLLALTGLPNPASCRGWTGKSCLFQYQAAAETRGQHLALRSLFLLASFSRSLSHGWHAYSRRRRSGEKKSSVKVETDSHASVARL